MLHSISVLVEQIVC